MARGRHPAGSGDPREELLGGRDIRATLRRVWEGDPLGLWARVVERLGTRTLMLDATRLFSETAARIAYDAFDADFAAEGGLDLWLSARVEQAVEDCLREDREHERMGEPLDEATRAQYEFAARGLGIGIELARRACVVFNSMPDAQRAAVWALTVAGATAEEHARRTGATPRQVREYVENAERALAALGAGRDSASDTDGSSQP